MPKQSKRYLLSKLIDASTALVAFVLRYNKCDQAHEAIQSLTKLFDHDWGSLFQHVLIHAIQSLPKWGRLESSVGYLSER